MAGFDGEEDTLPGVNESRLALNFEAACQRLGLGLLLLIILLAVAGVFSNGYVSTATKENTAKTLTVNYERYGRLQTEYKLAFTAKGVQEDHYEFRLGGDFNKAFQPGSITPQPDSMFSRGNTLHLIYNNVSNKQDFTVWLYITPTQFGNTVSSLGLNNQPDITFRQFIYP
ncbi:TPA: hypothetical protein QH025_001917 [Enterobacter cancerogenus]|nr:hypothetical protein [Enterobacter cancerogenus]